MNKIIAAAGTAFALSVPLVNADVSELPVVPLSVLSQEPMIAQGSNSVTAKPLPPMAVKPVSTGTPRARTTYDTGSPEAQTSKRVQMIPGVNQIVVVSIGHLNRIVTPFDNPQVRTTSNVTTQVQDNVVYMATQNEKPVTMYITPKDDEGVALSLTLVPRAVPPVELSLEVDRKSIPALANKAGVQAAKWEESQPYVQTMRSVMRSLALSEIPQGYTLSEMEPTDPRPICVQEGMDFDFEAGQKLTGHHLRVVVGVAQNLTTMPREIDLTACANYNVAGASAWPFYMLEPGMRTEVYVAMRDNQTKPRSASRPSLLGSN